jgi:hydrogenase nickel incorporation protein HypA/HybF
MHELALSQSIVELLAELSAKEGLRTVTKVFLVVGEAAGVECESLRFCFDAATRDTLAEGAELHIERTPALGECVHCHDTFPMPGGLAPCPACRQWGARLVSGRDLRISAFEGD